MDIKQYTTSIAEFHITDEKEFLDFIDLKYPLFRNHLFNLKGDITPKIESFLKARGIEYIKNVTPPRVRGVQREKDSIEILNRVIRSGEEIKTPHTVLCLKRINDGAVVQTAGNFIALDEVDGMVKCEGAFMMLKTSPKTKVIFHNQLLNEHLEPGKSYKIVFSFKDNEIIIEELKDIKWD